MHDNEISTKEYWDRHSREVQADVAEMREHARTPWGRLERLERRVRRLQAEHTDSGRYSDAEIAQAQAEADALRAEIAETEEQAFRVEWTREVTAERRATWNALVKSGKLTKSGKVWMPALREQEVRQGWTLEQLKRAVALWS